jgi:hypothetical protein
MFLIQFSFFNAHHSANFWMTTTESFNEWGSFVPKKEAQKK